MRTCTPSLSGDKRRPVRSSRAVASSRSAESMRDAIAVGDGTNSLSFKQKPHGSTDGAAAQLCVAPEPALAASPDRA